MNSLLTLHSYCHVENSGLKKKMVHNAYMWVSEGYAAYLFGLFKAIFKHDASFGGLFFTAICMLESSQWPDIFTWKMSLIYSSLLMMKSVKQLFANSTRF